MLLGPLHYKVESLEFDPVTQYKFNFFWTWFWFLGMFAIPFWPWLYGHQVQALVIQELSIWALFISHYTNLPASEGATLSAGRINEIKGYGIFLRNKNARDLAKAAKQSYKEVSK